MVKVMTEPFGAVAPEGVCERTTSPGCVLLAKTLVEVRTFTWKPALRSVVSAAVRFCPTTLGRLTCATGMPLEMVRLTVSPFFTDEPGPGFVLSTVPTGFGDETWFTF